LPKKDLVNCDLMTINDYVKIQRTSFLFKIEREIMSGVVRRRWIDDPDEYLKTTLNDSEPPKNEESFNHTRMTFPVFPSSSKQALGLVIALILVALFFFTCAIYSENFTYTYTTETRYFFTLLGVITIVIVGGAWRNCQNLPSPDTATVHSSFLNTLMVSPRHKYGVRSQPSKSSKANLTTDSPASTTAIANSSLTPSTPRPSFLSSPYSPKPNTPALLNFDRSPQVNSLFSPRTQSPYAVATHFAPQEYFPSVVTKKQEDQSTAGNSNSTEANKVGYT
jgi:hypothetical protein